MINGWNEAGWFMVMVDGVVDRSSSRASFTTAAMSKS